MIKSLPTSAGDVSDAGLILGSGRSPGGGHGYPLSYSCLTGLKRLSMHTHTLLHRVRNTFILYAFKQKRIKSNDGEAFAVLYRGKCQCYLKLVSSSSLLFHLPFSLFPFLSFISCSRVIFEWTLLY